MKIKDIMLRPLALFSFSFYITIIVIRYAAVGVKLSVTAALTAAFIILLVFSKLKKSSSRTNKRLYIRALCALSLGAALSSAAAFAAFDIYLAHLEEKYCGEEADIEAVVEEIRYSTSFSASYIIKTRSINGNSVSLRMSLDDETGLETGNVIHTAAMISPVDRNGGILGNGEYLLADGVRLTAEGSDTEIIDYAAANLRIFLLRLNSRLTDILCDRRAGENSGIAAALFLGNRSQLKPSVTRDFRRLGISHVLALSGMHLAVVCGAISYFTKRIGAKERRIICAVFIIGYVFLTGASPSVCRAGIMLLIMYTANLTGRGGDSITNLGVSVLLLSATDPFGAGGISLQLSAAAVLAILLQADRIDKISTAAPKKRNKIVKAFVSIRSSVRLTVSVIMFTLPLMWLYFGYVSIISPVTSLIFSGIASIILCVAPAAVIASPAAHFSKVVFRIEGMLCNFTADLAARISALHGITVTLDSTFMLVLCILCAAVFTAFCITQGKMKKFTAVISAVLLIFTCALGAAIQNRDGAVFITAVNNKSSDEIVIDSRGRTMVIDIGNGYKTSINNALSGSTDTEIIMLTHSHTAYPSSLADIFDRHLVRCLMVSDDFDEDMLLRLQDVCRQKNVMFEVYSPGDTVFFGETEVKTYKNLYLKRSSQPIVRIDVSAFKNSFTYLGASYSETCENIDIDPLSTVWLGCHGPKYKSQCTMPPEFEGRLMTADSTSDFAPDGTEYLSVTAFFDQ